MTPANYQERQLRDVVTFEKGKPPAQQPYFGADAERYLTPDYLRGGNSAELVKPGANAIYVNDGDAIVLWDGSNAGEVMRGRSGVLASTMSRLSHGAEFDRAYFFYAVKYWENYLKGQTSGSGIPHVDKEIFGKLTVIEFEKPEQTKIAEILSTVDRAIEQTEALIAKQQRIKTGLMQGLLTRGIDEHGNLRSEEADWNYTSVGRHLRTIEQGWSPDCENVSAASGQWGVLKTTSVVWEGFRYHENKLLPPHLKPRKRYEVKVGDVLMTRAGPNSRVGVVAFVYETQPQLMLSDKLYRLIPDNSLDAEFLVLALASERTQRYLSTLKTGLAESQTNISQDIVRSLQIPLPCKKEQVQIAKTIRSARERLYSDVRLLAKMRLLKTALMQDLLTGKVRVTPLLSEPEEASA